MKKSKILLMLSLSAMLLFAGCGKDDDNLPVSPDDIAEPITTQAPPSEPAGEATPDPVEEEEADVPPEEGLVHSSLTNEWVAEEVSNSRPIAVMFPIDKGAQPQYGIGLAGVLYECAEEGGMTRQMGVIEDWQSLEHIGNIRSCRSYYVYWSMEWDALLVHWGGPYYLVNEVAREDVNNLTGCGVGTGPVTAPATGAGAFYRWQPDPNHTRDSVHTGFTDGAKLAETAEKLGYSLTHRTEYFVPKHFSFAPMATPNTLEDIAGSFEATSVDLSKIFTTTKSSFEYDAEKGTYRKFLWGSPQIDAITGEQLEFANIIIQDTGWGYHPDNKYLYFYVEASGRTGWYFTQGRGIRITWTKESDYSPTRYYDLSGNEIKLNTGHTYIGVAQEGREPIYN